MKRNAPLWVRNWRDAKGGYAYSTMLFAFLEFRDWRRTMNPLDAMVFSRKHEEIIVLAGKWGRVTVNQIALLTDIPATRVRQTLKEHGIQAGGVSGRIDPRGISYLLQTVLSLKGFQKTGTFQPDLISTICDLGTPRVVSNMTGIPYYVLTRARAAKRA